MIQKLTPIHTKMTARSKDEPQPPATCISCGETEGNHKDICRFTCPTTGCTVTYDGTDYTHSASSCLYKDPDVYCTECGYMTYNAEDDDYYHDENCSIGNENQDNSGSEPDNAPGPIEQEYLVNGVTYFGVDSDYFADSTKLFIQDMLSAKTKSLAINPLRLCGSIRLIVFRMTTAEIPAQANSSVSLIMY